MSEGHHYVYSYGYNIETADPLTTVQVKSHLDACHSTMSVPADPEFVPSKTLAVVPFRGGIFVCGGAADDRGSRYWIPGDDKWTTTKTMKQVHYYGAAVALDGDTTILVAGSYNDVKLTWSAGAEIFNSTSARWRKISKMPITTVNAVLIAKNDNEIYLFGGEQKGHMWNDALPNVLKYNRLVDQWTILPEAMPRGGPHPSCGKATHHSKSVVMCMGTATSLGGEIDIFDLNTETWTTLGDLSVPSPVTYGSLVVSVGNKLYKIRGYDSNGKETNSMNILNLDDDEWENPAVSLEASPASYKQLVVLPTIN